MMKKFLFSLFILVMCILIAGCGSKPQITLSEEELVLAVGEMYFINPVVTGVKGSALINYDVDNEEVLSIEDNCIEAYKEGNATIVLSLQDYPDVKCELKVTVTAEPNITIEGKDFVYVGGETQLKANVSGISENIVWSSSDETVATVDGNGKVTGKKLGKVTIIAEGGDYYAEFAMTVKRMPEIVINGDSEVIVGGTIKLEASLRQLQGTVEWISSDSSILSISKDGIVTGIKEGKANVTAQCGEFSEVKEIEVVVASIEITGSNKVYVGESVQLQARVKGISNSSNVSFVWTSSLDSIAVVNGGNVKGVQEGTVTIKASWNNLETSFDMDVVLRREVKIEGSNKVDLNDITKLTVETLNVKGDITWSSNDESIATVDDKGVVTGNKIGTATITATVEGVSGTFEIRVVSVTDKVTYYFEGGTSEELYKNEKVIASFDITSYNANSGTFWGGGYSSNVYLTDRYNDTGATFSDRIYIGKNEYTGFYEIKGILTSGGSYWIDGAEYVITISTGYHTYRTIHNQVLNLKEGDVVIIYSDDITKINSSNTCRVGFFDA